MNKILKSAAIIAFVAAIAVGATSSYFSDTETSTGNTFTAGSIDLKVDNESYWNGVYQSDLSWTLDDLTGHLFFDFADLKPGDDGEDTISLHVSNNDAWACAYVSLTSNQDNTCVDPEYEDDANCAAYDSLVPSTNSNGDLAQKLQFAWWADDGDNVYETDETLIHSIGPLGSIGVGNTMMVILADSDTNNVGGDDGEPMEGCDNPADCTYHIAKAWCFGDLVEDPVQEGSGISPAIASGFTCNGEDVNNASQSDKTTLDVSFTAVQERNNVSFVCPVVMP